MDEGLLESALSRPKAKWFYTQPPDDVDIFDLAAAYGYGITKNHAFRDGNKRTGAATTLLFLALNGVEIPVSRLTISQMELVELLVSVAQGHTSEHGLAVWLRSRSY